MIDELQLSIFYILIEAIEIDRNPIAILPFLASKIIFHLWKFIELTTKGGNCSPSPVAKLFLPLLHLLHFLPFHHGSIIELETTGFHVTII